MTKNKIAVLFVGFVFLVNILLPTTIKAQQPPRLRVPLEGVKLLRMPATVTRVVIGEPDRVRVSVINTREILLFGKKSGATTLHVWTENGSRKYYLSIEKISDRDMGDADQDVLRELNEVGKDGRELRAFIPQYRDVSEYKSYIEQLLQEGEGKVLLSDAVAGKIFVLGKPEVLDKIGNLLESLDVPGEELQYTRRIQLENRPVQEMQEKVTDMLSEDGKVIIDEETNSLMVVDQVSKVKEMESFLRAIDVKTVAQVRIEAKFVEMTDEAEKQIGINWDYTGSFNGQEFSSNMVPQLSDLTAGGVQVPGGGMQLDLVKGTQNLGARMQFLEKEGLVNLISSPNVVTRNQQEAKLVIKNEQSYVADYETSSAEGVVTVTPVIETLADGITLTATPLIGQGDIIQLKIKPTLEIATLGTPISTPNGNIYTPTTDIREAELNVALRDGQTLIIGGLNREQASSSNNSVPLLGKIPLIGKLFFSQNKDSRENRKITIFLTANIVRLREGEDESIVSDTTAISTIDTPVLSP